MTMMLRKRDDDGAECVEARVSVGGPSASRDARHPGGLHVSGTRPGRLHPAPSGILSSARRHAVRSPGIAGIVKKHGSITRQASNVLASVLRDKLYSYLEHRLNFLNGPTRKAEIRVMQ